MVTKAKFEVMLAKSYDPERIQNWKHTYVEPKLDGIRVIILHDGDDIRFYSRNGRELDMFGHIKRDVDILRNLLIRENASYEEGLVLDGEMVSKTAQFGDISGAIHRKGYTAYDAQFFCFHQMPSPCFEYGKDTATQLFRREQLLSAMSGNIIKNIAPARSIRAESDDEVQLAYSKLRSKNFEGAMVKNMMMPWEAKRSYAWMKMKAELSKDLVVVDMKEGKGKYTGQCGALIVKNGKTLVKVSGMLDEQRVLFWKKPSSIVGRLVEVSYQEETDRGSLRHPRFKRIRDDKEVAHAR